MKKLLTLLVSLTLLFTLVGCGSKTTEVETKKVSVAASPTPHAEILEKAKEILAEKGWELDIVEFEDYVQPIEVVESEEIDCNYFAHTPYLNNYNNEHGTTQTVVGKVHYEPFGVYPGTKSSFTDLAAGDEIVVPNDGTNETRALLLLQDNGIITLPEGTNAESLVTVLDIVSYSVDVKIVEVEAATVSRYQDQAALVVLNGNYALAAGLSVAKDSIAYESATSSAAVTYVNVVATTEANKDNEGVKALVEVLESQEIKDFINSKWDGSVIPFAN